MKNSCIRCGRRGKMVSLCMDCELFVSRLTLPGVKPEALRRAKDYLRTGDLRRMKNRKVFKAVSTSKRSMVGRVYRTSDQQCTCPSGVYRGLKGAACKHSHAVQLLRKKSKR